MKKQTAFPQPAAGRGEAARSVPMTKSQKLARIRARQQAAWNKMRKLGLPLLADAHPLYKKWTRLLHQGDRLEETFIAYQGQDIDAPRVAYQSGDISTRPGFFLDSAEERLHRDDAGHYYLVRQLVHNGPFRVHRISIQAAALWAVTRVNPDTNHLRRDVVAMMTGRKEAA